MTGALDTHKLAAARVWAAARMPYLAAAMFASAVRADPGGGTIAVDRSWVIRADPAVVDELSPEQLGRLLVHLCSHLLRDHAARADALGVAAEGGGARWNRSTDAEVNDDLLASDCVPDLAPTMPQDLGCEPGRLAEHYYTAGAEAEWASDCRAGAGSKAGWDCGSGADGCLRPGEGGGGLGAQQAQLLRLATAADIHRRAGREPGSVPGSWLRWAESVLPSRVDWRRVLAAEVRSAVTAVAGQVDYSYRRPSRRAHLSPDVVLPTLVRPVPDVAIICDTSGSMHDRLLARALAEVEGVLSRAGLRRAQVRVLAVDTDVHHTRRVSRASQVRLAGGGGTDMGAGIAAAVDLRPRPSVVVVLTDGYTPWPERPPRGVRIVVGLLVEPGAPHGWKPPDWARTVFIDDRDESSSPVSAPLT